MKIKILVIFMIIVSLVGYREYSIFSLTCENSIVYLGDNDTLPILKSADKIDNTDIGTRKPLVLIHGHLVFPIHF